MTAAVDSASSRRHTPLYREIGGLEDKGFGHEIKRADRVGEFAITGCIQGV